jgi:hypothetical protein
VPLIHGLQPFRIWFEFAELFEIIIKKFGFLGLIVTVGFKMKIVVKDSAVSNEATEAVSMRTRDRVPRFQ